MTRLISWVREHKLATILFFILLFFVYEQSLPSEGIIPMMGRGGSTGISSTEVSAPMGIPEGGLAKSDAFMMYQPPVPPSDTRSRMVTKDTSLSLKVDDVSGSVTAIETIAESAGGYLVDSNLSVPEGGASATVSIRVPSEKRALVLSSLKQSAIKVVSEYVNGQDVTDQYTDTEERLRILTGTKTKFEDILAKAVNVNEMLNVQREILSIQSQIDSLKGQQKYLEGISKLTRITVYLATDELALPYAPDHSWRPSVIVKEAVRSLILRGRSVATVAIYLAVYFPVWGGLMLIAWILKKKMG